MVIRHPSMRGLESMGHWKSRSFRTHKETNKRRCRGGSSWGTSHPITLLCASTVSLLHNPTSSGQNVLHNIQCRELHNIQCANYWATSNAQNMMQHPMYKLLDNIQCTEARLKHCPRVGSYAYALAGEPAFRRITCYVTKAGSQWCPLYRGSTIPWQTPVYNSHQGWIPMVVFIQRFYYTLTDTCLQQPPRLDPNGGLYIEVPLYLDPSPSISTMPWEIEVVS
jgi:hypothetical protein